MALIPAGVFQMGSSEMFDFEAPVHQVSIRKPFYIGRREVTYEEWDACIAEAGCKQRPDDRGLGRARRPATDLDWDDAKGYVAWLSQKTGHTYRLPTESEWEYVARAGSTTTYPWGRTVEKDKANCIGCTSDPVKKAIGHRFVSAERIRCLRHDGQCRGMGGGLLERYLSRSPDRWISVDKAAMPRTRIARWLLNNDPRYLRSAARFKYDHDVRFYTNGFRVVREN